ncbi:MAG: IS5/IS1182 family transposase, partial [Allosphingosinicella sp.]
MAVRSTGQFSFVDAMAPQLSGGSGRLDRIAGLVKWYRFEKLLACLRDGGAGRPAYPSLLMFKVLLLQSL